MGSEQLGGPLSRQLRQDLRAANVQDFICQR